MDTKTKIKALLCMQDKNIDYLSKALDKSHSNMSMQLTRGDFKESALRNIANALNCDLAINFINRDTGEVL